MSEIVNSIKKAKVDPNEPKDAKFRRLASTRGDKLIHQMKLLKNLGTSYAYRMDADLAEELLNKFDKHVSDLRDTWVTKITEMRKTTEPVDVNDIDDEVDVNEVVESEEEPAVIID